MHFTIQVDFHRLRLRQCAIVIVGMRRFYKGIRVYLCILSLCAREREKDGKREGKRWRIKSCEGRECSKDKFYNEKERERENKWGKVVVVMAGGEEQTYTKIRCDRFHFFSRQISQSPYLNSVEFDRGYERKF